MDRRLWTQQEDQHITRLVNKFGTKKWPLISEKLCSETEYERTGKQCRQRWYNHLNPEINTTLWDDQDEQQLFEAHKQYGNKWKVISRLFVGRTDNSIKNHFYSTIRRCLRRINKLQGEKNSTLKMRTIKPYVLSKILADRNLTETILELGKIKPSKSRRQFQSQYFDQFNQMITKLYQINKQYQMVKINKKNGGEKSKENNGSPDQPSIQQEQDEENSESMSSHSQKEVKKQSKTMVNGGNQPKQIIISKQQIEKTIKPLCNRKKSILKMQTIPSKSSLQEYKLVTLSQIKRSNSDKRSRKSINYMKLNEGILCQNDRPDGTDQTNHDSELARKKEVEFSERVDHMSLQQQFYGNGMQNLDEIIEQQQKSNGLQMRQNLFQNDQADSKGMKHFQISNPSPSFHRNGSFFDDLVVIGTHLKIFATPHKEHSGEKADYYQSQRKQSEQQFIEQILQINFDPQFAMKPFSDEQE